LKDRAGNGGARQRGVRKILAKEFVQKINWREIPKDNVAR
jgi:hypothetical protein